MSRITFPLQQRGFTLIELAIAVIIAGALAMAGLSYQAQELRYEIARAQVDQLKVLNAALAKYLAKYPTELVAATNVLQVAVDMAPTVAELRALGFLDASFSATNLYSPTGGYALSVRTTPAGCSGSICSLFGLAYLTTPVLDAKGNVDNAAIGEAISYGGGSVGATTDLDKTTIRGINGMWSVVNPMGNVSGILATRNVQDGIAYLPMDGSVAMAGSLKMGGNDISSVKDIGATGLVSAANLIVSNNVSTGTAQINSVASVGTACTTTGLLAQDGGGLLLTCQSGIWKKAVKSPNSYRFMFTSTQTWTVPAGVSSAFVTMAGGGGSGLGWRVVSTYITGHSGGYVFSQPINFVAGETVQVIVGTGGKAYAPYSTGIPVTAYPWYSVFANPSGDNGIGGYPGTQSKLISPSTGVLLECDGGSGASSGGIDNYSGSLVAGNMSGATFGSGVPSYSAPSRVAAGPYASEGGPGACGPARYGIGNVGSASWNMASGNHSGGMTPFGYGSGGDVWISGCFVSTTNMGTCVSPSPGRDGVVFIDVLY